ncbi:hypothetical protein KCV07_g9534, partial [Aureobasidium melanogenum]
MERSGREKPSGGLLDFRRIAVSTSRLHLDQRQAPHVSGPISGAQDDSSSNTSGSTWRRQKHVSMTPEATLGSSNIASGTCSVASTIKKEKPSDQIGHMNILKSASSMASDLSHSVNKVAKDDPAIDKALGNIKADKDSAGATKTSTASLFQFGAETFSSSFAFYPQPVATKEATTSTERERYMHLHHTEDNNMSGVHEQLRTAPLVSLSVKQRSETKDNKLLMFPQYALLGCRISNSCSSEGEGDPTEPEPILLNTNTPWSMFICGSQGSGKSYTLSAIIENCLYTSPKIGKLPKPLAGVVFHNNTRSSHDICEAAHLVSLGIKVNVLVSRSNYHALWSIYRKAVSPQAARFLNIQPIVLQSHHLTAERMHRLMAFQEAKTAVPLYMEIILRILREMAITGLPFSYAAFKTRLSHESLQPVVHKTSIIRVADGRQLQQRYYLYYKSFERQQYLDKHKISNEHMRKAAEPDAAATIKTARAKAIIDNLEAVKAARAAINECGGDYSKAISKFNQEVDPVDYGPSEVFDFKKTPKPVSDETVQHKSTESYRRFDYKGISSKVSSSKVSSAADMQSMFKKRIHKQTVQTDLSTQSDRASREG